ncbi:MAG: hypothetical protein H6561_19870 [Lewinellaceae bacterium]|nr:hypothetical protein [Lewinellaceae bacterium]
MKFLFTLFLCISAAGIIHAQTIALNPDNGNAGSAFTVTITGTATAFSVASTTTARISNGIESYDISGSATSATRFSGTLDLPPDATSGLYNATLWQQGTAGTFWSCADCFTINAACLLNATATVTPAACSGDSSGAISLDVIGTMGGESYLWSNGETSKNISGLAAGSYSVTITEGNCMVSVTAVVTEPDPLILSSEVTSESTAGAGDGSIVLQVSGGTIPYTFDWSNGATTKDISGLSAGSYQVTVMDSNGCETTSTEIQVMGGDCALMVNVNSTPIFCNGDNSGAIMLQVTGAVGNTSVQWSNGAPDTTIISGLFTGNYQYTVTDDAACTITGAVSLASPDPVGIVVTTSNVACAGDSTGSASAVVNGAQGVYSISWSNGDLGDSTGNLKAGNYTVYAMDELGCLTSDSFMILENTPITLTVDTIISMDGNIQVTVQGGTEPYAYLWSDDTSAVSTDEDLTGASPGLYRLEVTDALGCQITSDTLRIESTSARFDQQLVNQIRVYPNPVGSQLTLRLPQALVGSRLTLINALGQNIWEGNASGQLTTVTNQRWASGWHSLRIRQYDREISIPILVH